MNRKKPYRGKWLGLLLLGMIFLLSGCGDITVFDPKGPVAESQRDLIVYSLYFMGGIILVVYVAFAIILVKYRNHPNRKKDSYKPHLHGNNIIEAIWIIIPVLIVAALSVPTVTTLFDLEEPPESSNDQEPLVIYATSADWKWIFSYPEQDIETVNYLHIPTDRAIEFRLSSTASMAALWIPALGGQKYNMAGMQNILYLQADETGVFVGKNSSFNGEGYAKQSFNVYAEDKKDFNDWVNAKQKKAPKLTQAKYNEIIKPGLVDTMTFSNTHRQWVKHGEMMDMDYFIKRYKDDYKEPLGIENNGKHENSNQDSQGKQVE